MQLEKVGQPSNKSFSPFAQPPPLYPSVLESCLGNSQSNLQPIMSSGKPISAGEVQSELARSPSRQSVPHIQRSERAQT